MNRQVPEVSLPEKPAVEDPDTQVGFRDLKGIAKRRVPAAQRGPDGQKEKEEVTAGGAPGSRIPGHRPAILLQLCCHQHPMLRPVTENGIHQPRRRPAILGFDVQPSIGKGLQNVLEPRNPHADTAEGEDRGTGTRHPFHGFRTT